MKIISYQSKRYAGTRDQSAHFEPGLNVVLGDNEAGKSTMINGVYHTIFTSHSLKSATKGSGKDELKKFLFPVDGSTHIDGEVQFEVSGEEYIVRKTWDSVNLKRCSTDLEGKALLTDFAAEEKIEELLPYGEAFYRYIVFGRQSNESSIVQKLTSFQSGDPESIDMRHRVASAAASGGFAEERFLQKLNETIKKLDGRWELNSGLPQYRKEGGRWEIGIGTVVASYYELLDAKDALEKARGKIANVEELDQNLKDVWKKKEKADDELESLQKRKGAIDSAEHLRNIQKLLTQEITNLQRDAKEWPELMQEEKYLNDLKAERDERNARCRRDDLEGVLAKNNEYENAIREKKQAMQGKEGIETYWENYRDLSYQLSQADAKLKSGTLHAKISLDDGHRANLETADGVVAVAVDQYVGPANGYVRLTIPDVGEVLVAPATVDVDELTLEIADLTEKMQKILATYGADDFDKLTELKNEFKDSSRAIEDLQTEQRNKLGGRTVEEIQSELSNIVTNPDITVPENLDEQIQKALQENKEQTLEECKAAVKSRLVTLITRHASIELQQKIDRKKDEKEKIDIEASDPVLQGETMTKVEYENEVSRLNMRLNGPDGSSGINEEIRNAYQQFILASKAAEDLDLDALQRDVETKEELFHREEQKLKYYTQIKKDFEEIQKSQGSRYSGFYQTFNRFLAIIADDRLQISEEGGIQSNGFSLKSSELFSQGTRKVILLAFRLALIKSYFADEPALVVLDDVLLDMDPDRRKHAAELLQTFAQDNQVIFTTCDPGIAKLLGGNLIRIARN